METITLPIENLNLASFDRIQKQVFETSCIACHGGSTHISGNLNLTEDKAYAALVNVEAPLSPEKKKYVSPGNAEESYLIDILEGGPEFLDSFDAELFGELVERIIIESNDSVRFCLKNGLELRESIERTVR